MALLDGALARLFGAALGTSYRPAILHRVSQQRLRGGSTIEMVADVPCRAQVDASWERYDDEVGATTRELRILVLAASLSGAIGSNDRITLDGARYAIAGVERDPAGALHILRVRHG